jgi:hypothetical protein
MYSYLALSQYAGSTLHCFDDTLMRATTTEVKIERQFNLIGRRIRVVSQQSACTGQYAAQAISTLTGLFLHKSLMQGMQSLPSWRQSFHGFDGLTYAGFDRNIARSY